ncbi:MAG TPA: DUF6599 family protein [Bryobacteraceae bacterium]|nr:DUF6599 family protein [Bryobacteraceae bacterium]
MLRRVISGQLPVTSCQFLVTLALSAGLAHAAIFPDPLGALKKVATKPVVATDQALDAEYGLREAEQIEYASPTGRFTATAWRFDDSTGAMSFFEARRPAAAKPSNLSQLAAAIPDGVLYAFGNYVFEFKGGQPTQAELTHLYGVIPKLENSPLPALMDFLPTQNLIPNSQRYVLGPVSLARFDPGIPPSVAAFHLDSEAQIGTYRTDKGPMTMAIFSYPTPGIARQQDAGFQKIQGAVVKRSGPLVAVILHPQDANAAESTLALVRYEQNLTLNERPPGEEVRDDAQVMLNIFAFAGILLGMCIIAGIGFGAFRVLLRKLGWKGGQPEPLIVLRLGEK